MLNIIKNVLNEQDLLFIFINILLCVSYMDRCRFVNKKDRYISRTILCLSMIFIWGYFLKTMIWRAQGEMLFNHMIFFFISNIFIILAYLQKDKLFKCWNGIFFFTTCISEYTFMKYIDSITITNHILPKTYESTYLSYLTFTIILLWFICILSDKFVDFSLKRIGIRPDFDHMKAIVIGYNEEETSSNYISSKEEHAM